jgi:SynChlorMet cassette radical SAM/SPASM protein ScmF
MGCEPELLKIEAKPTATQKIDLPDGVPPLTSLYMYIAGSCNLACRHCWISPTFEPDNSKGQFLKLEYIKKAVREAKPLGLQSVKLTGGEPMLHPQIREIVEFLESESIGMIMETNGTLIDDEMARFLKSKHHFNFISVSVDGATAETHETLRGVPGSFEKAIFGIKALVKVSLQPQMICTLHKGNVADIDEIINFAENLGCGSIKFNNIQQLGRGELFNDDQRLSVPETLALFNKIENDHAHQIKLKIFFDIPIAFFPTRKLLDSSLNSCNVKNILGIIANGEISLCGIGVTTKDLVFGNINDDSLNQIWQANPILQKIRKEIPGKLDGICGNCIHKHTCLGVCVAANYQSSKKINSANCFCKTAEEIDLFPISRKSINFTGGKK